MSLAESTSLKDARSWLAVNLEDGVECPCCGQHAETYRRTVTAPMVRTLAKVYERQSKPAEFRGVEYDRGEYWVHLSAVPQRSRDVATTQYWALFQMHPDKRGWWRVTMKGEAFLAGQVSIEQYAYVYNGNVRGFSGPRVGVDDVDREFRLEDIRGQGRIV